MTVTNTFAYKATNLFMAVKCFIVHTPVWSRLTHKYKIFAEKVVDEEEKSGDNNATRWRSTVTTSLSASSTATTASLPEPIRWSTSTTRLVRRSQVWPGNTKGEVSLYHWPPVWLVLISQKTKIVSCRTANSKPVKQEDNGTVILPPLVFPGLTQALAHSVLISPFVKSMQNGKLRYAENSFVPGRAFKLQPRSLFLIWNWKVRSWQQLKGASGRNFHFA